MKEYRNKKVEETIQLNLAKICGSPDDVLKIVRLEYVKDFDCELCGHQHLTRVYWIKNMNTELIIKVGSECVHHFGNRIPQSDIDKADAMMKLVEKSIQEGRANKVREFGTKIFMTLAPEIQAARYFSQNDLRKIFGEERYADLPQSTTKLYSAARDDLIEALGNEYFKNLPREEKFSLINTFYRNNYAAKLFEEVKHNDHLLTKEEMDEVLSLGLSDQLKAAVDYKEEQKRIAAKRKEIEEFKSAMYTKLNELLNEVKNVDDALANEWTTRAAELGLVSYFVKNEIDYHSRRIEYKRQEIERMAEFNKKYSWIIDYAGDDSVILNCKDMINRHYQISDVQYNYAKLLYSMETNPDTKEKFGWLLNYSGTNTTVMNIQDTLRRRGEITDNQYNYAKSLYEAETKPKAANDELESMFDALIAKFPTIQKYRGIRAYYHLHGKMSELQEKCIRNDYAKNC